MMTTTGLFWTDYIPRYLTNIAATSWWVADLGLTDATNLEEARFKTIMQS